MKRWPALKVPPEFAGYFVPDAGIVKAKKALTAMKELSLKQGAELLFSQEVVSIGENEVVLSNEKRIRAKHIVVACGAFTSRFTKEFNEKRTPVETLHFSDPSGLPPAMMVYDFDGQENDLIYGLYDGEDFSTYKIGHDKSSGDAVVAINLMKEFMPSKIDTITHTQPCSFSRTPNMEFIFEKRGSTIYAFGLSGKGFKHGPYHGKRIYHLIKGDKEEADKYKARL